MLNYCYYHSLPKLPIHYHLDTVNNVIMIYDNPAVPPHKHYIIRKSAQQWTLNLRNLKTIFDLHCYNFIVESKNVFYNVRHF